MAPVAEHVSLQSMSNASVLLLQYAVRFMVGPGLISSVADGQIVAPHWVVLEAIVSGIAPRNLRRHELKGVMQNQNVCRGPAARTSRPSSARMASFSCVLPLQYPPSSNPPNPSSGVTGLSLLNTPYTRLPQLDPELLRLAFPTSPLSWSP